LLGSSNCRSITSVLPHESGDFDSDAAFLCGCTPEVMPCNQSLMPTAASTSGLLRHLCYSLLTVSLATSGTSGGSGGLLVLDQAFQLPDSTVEEPTAAIFSGLVTDLVHAEQRLSEPGLLRGFKATSHSSDGLEAANQWSEEVTPDAEIKEVSDVFSKKALAQLTEKEAKEDAAQATVDQAAAEAMAAEELRKASSAAARARDAWARANQAHNQVLRLSAGFEAENPVRARLDVPNFPVQVQKRDEVSAGNTTVENGTDCNTNTTLQCTIQRVITFDHKTSAFAGGLEWVGLAGLWLGSIYLSCCVCDGHCLCLCQLMSCAGIGFIVLTTLNVFSGASA